MKKKIGKRISALVSMVMVLSMLVSSGSVWAKEKNNQENIMIQISDNTNIELSSETLKLLKKNNISMEQLKQNAILQINDFLLEKNLDISKQSIKAKKATAYAASSIPPGATSRTYSGSNTGKVFAGIPAVGWNYLYIPYSYNYTKWTHSLYQAEGYILNSSSVGTSYFKGVSMGTWQHLYGTVEYANTMYGKNLEVIATGILTFGFSITIMTPIGPIPIPANIATEQSFLYFHAV